MSTWVEFSPCRLISLGIAFLGTRRVGAGVDDNERGWQEHQVIAPCCSGGAAQLRVARRWRSAGPSFAPAGVMELERHALLESAIVWGKEAERFTKSSSQLARKRSPQPAPVRVALRRSTDRSRPRWSAACLAAPDHDEPAAYPARHRPMTVPPDLPRSVTEGPAHHRGGQTAPPGRAISAAPLQQAYGSAHTPTSSNPEGGASYHGLQNCPLPGHCGSATSQTGVQQLILSAHSSALVASMHNKPGAHELKFGHGSPNAPCTLSSITQAQTSESGIGRQVEPSQSSASGLQNGRQSDKCSEIWLQRDAGGQVGSSTGPVQKGMQTPSPLGSRSQQAAPASQVSMPSRRELKA